MQAGGGERGRATFRFPVPPSMAGDDGDLDDMAGMLRMILQDATIGGPSARFTVQVRRTGPAAAAAGGGGAGAAGREEASSGGSRSSPRAGRSPSRISASRRSSGDSSRAGRQRGSTLFNYFSNSPTSRRSRSNRSVQFDSARRHARSSSAARPASRSVSEVIDLANDDSEG